MVICMLNFESVFESTATTLLPLCIESGGIRMLQLVAVKLMTLYD